MAAKIEIEGKELGTMASQVNMTLSDQELHKQVLDDMSDSLNGFGAGVSYDMNPASVKFPNMDSLAIDFS